MEKIYTSVWVLVSHFRENNSLLLLWTFHLIDEMEFLTTYAQNVPLSVYVECGENC